MQTDLLEVQSGTFFSHSLHQKHTQVLAVLNPTIAGTAPRKVVSLERSHHSQLHLARSILHNRPHQSAQAHKKRGTGLFLSFYSLNNNCFTHRPMPSSSIYNMTAKPSDAPWADEPFPLIATPSRRPELAVCLIRFPLLDKSCR